MYIQMMKSIVLVTLITLSIGRSTFPNKTPLDGQTVTYGTMLKLYHPQTGYMLHSHSIKFSMNGIYSVTGYANDDLGSYWQIKQKLKAKSRTYTDAVKCGDVITLTSVIINYYLQTQETAVGLTSQLDQFVRGIGREGMIDEQVNWKIICQVKKEGQDIKFGDMIRFKHSKTGKYASLDKSYVYHEGNCGRGCIIAGQLQPHAIERGDDDRSIFQMVAAMKLSSGEQFKQQ